MRSHHNASLDSIEEEKEPNMSAGERWVRQACRDYVGSKHSLHDFEYGFYGCWWWID
jgi:hypothetical protein